MPAQTCPLGSPTADRTALAVALVALADAGRARRPTEALALARAGGRHRMLARIAAWGPGGRLLRRAVDFRFGGLATHVAARKRVVWDTCQAFAARSPRGQVAFLGAGADSTPTILARTSPELRVLAIDSHAAPADAAPANLRTAVLDLARDDPTALPAWDLDRPTLAIAEGLFMYLPRRAAAALWQRLVGGAPGPACHLLGSYLDAKALTSPRSGVAKVQRYLIRRGHPGFEWSATWPDLEAELRTAGFEATNLCPTAPGARYGEVLFRADSPAAAAPAEGSPLHSGPCGSPSSSPPA